jgi:hypothetical protein
MNNEPESMEALLHEQELLERKVIALENKMIRESVEMWDNYVDPLDAFRGEDGEMWSAVGGGSIPAGSGFERHGWRVLAELTIARRQCQLLAETNEYAINGHENRINYIIGTGHTLSVASKKNMSVSDDKLAAVQKVLDEWTEEVQWARVQQEIVRRYDRDGETFIRFFNVDGHLQLRFVEPWHVNENHGDNRAPFGIITEADDVETVIAYTINDTEVPASDIQHRKANVDNSVRRGQPLMYPVIQGLRRATKLQRNMSAASDIQTAIAMIRKHTAATSTAVSTFRSTIATATTTNQTTGEQRNFQRYRPGSIIDAPAGTEYDFPSGGLDASRYVPVLESQLRSIASRLVMPEFMLTSNAANANYGSTMVAEGPCVKMFEREQWHQHSFDLQIYNRVVRMAIDRGELPDGIDKDICIHPGMPRLQVRDSLKDAQVSRIYLGMGILSPQTAAAQAELEFHQEEENIAAYKKEHPGWNPTLTAEQSIPNDQGTRGDKNSPDNGDGASGNNQNSLKREQSDAITILEAMYP